VRARRGIRDRVPEHHRPAILYSSLKATDIHYVLLSDSRLEAAKAFHIAYRVDEAAADCQSGSRPPITRQMLRRIGMPFTLSISRAHELGYQSIVTWERGIAAMWLSRKL
jgi:hypothetical protein